MCDQDREGSNIAAEVIFKCITEGDNQPGEPQCVNLVGQVAEKADVTRKHARYLISVAVGKFNAAGLRALFEDLPE